MVVIMNAPYSGNLHLKILREAMQHSDDIVNLSPITSWQKEFVDEQPFSTPITDIEYIDKYDMCNHFKISIRVDCGIIHVVGGNTTSDSQKFSHIVKYADLRKKFRKFNKINFTKFVSKKPSEYTVRMFSGCNRDYGHHWTVCPITEAAAFRTEITGHIGFLNFKTELERNNCYKLMSSPIIKAICEITDGTFTPIMSDYTRPWTDSDLYAYFGLTADEISIIEKEMAKHAC